MKTIVYIDTRNFLGKLEEVFKFENVPMPLWHEYDFGGLVSKVLEGIAVDMVAQACDGQVKTAILASSDSDLQPAVREVSKRNIEVIYLGFERMPNKGLTATTKRTILIRNAEVLAAAKPV